MAYALKTSCAKNIIGVIPYFPYSKQCKMRKRGSIVCKLLASMLAKAGRLYQLLRSWSILLPLRTFVYNSVSGITLHYYPGLQSAPNLGARAPRNRGSATRYFTWAHRCAHLKYIYIFFFCHLPNMKMIIIIIIIICQLVACFYVQIQTGMLNEPMRKV